MFKIELKRATVTIPVAIGWIETKRIDRDTTCVGPYGSYDDKLSEFFVLGSVSNIFRMSDSSLFDFFQSLNGLDQNGLVSDIQKLFHSNSSTKNR